MAKKPKDDAPQTLSADGAEVKNDLSVKIVTDETPGEGMDVMSAVAADDETKKQLGITTSVNMVRTEPDTSADDAYLEQLKALADENDVEYGATIGADTLSERLDEAGVDVPPKSDPTGSKYGAATDDDGATVEVTVNATPGNPNPVRLNANGHLITEIWQGVPTDIPRSALAALRDSAVTFTTQEE